MLLTKHEVARQLAISTKTLQRLIVRGQIAVTRITDSTRGERIAAEEVARFIHDNTTLKGDIVWQLIDVAKFGGSKSTSPGRTNPYADHQSRLEKAMQNF